MNNVNNLKDKDLYYIGGIVRDELLGKQCFDTDLTYQGDAIKRFGILDECIKINRDFGTVRLSVAGKDIDIASTRDEIYEKKGHLPIVTDIGCDLKKDVLRRDFTINALAKSTLTNEIIDYVGGVNDIEAKVLRVLHKGSFIDDPTRILRGLKFSIRFGFELEPSTKKLQDEYLSNINYDMSYKRLKKELIETFNLNLQIGLDKFIKQGIYKLIGNSECKFPVRNVEDLINKYPVENPWLVYIGWHPDIEKLPLTKYEKKIIEDYRQLLSLKILSDNYSIYKSFEDKSKESILLYTIMTNSEVGLKYLSFSNAKISITGQDLLSLGIKPSEKYRECFDHILKEKLNVKDMSKEEELNLAKKFFHI